MRRLNQQEIENALNLSYSGNDAQVSDAELSIAEFRQHPGFTEFLINIIRDSSKSVEVRQSASINLYFHLSLCLPLLLKFDVSSFAKIYFSVKEEMVRSSLLKLGDLILASIVQTQGIDAVKQCLNYFFASNEVEKVDFAYVIFYLVSQESSFVEESEEELVEKVESLVDVLQIFLSKIEVISDASFDYLCSTFLCFLKRLSVIDYFPLFIHVFKQRQSVSILQVFEKFLEKDLPNEQLVQFFEIFLPVFIHEAVPNKIVIELKILESLLIIHELIDCFSNYELIAPQIFFQIEPLDEELAFFSSDPQHFFDVIFPSDSEYYSPRSAAQHLLCSLKKPDISNIFVNLISQIDTSTFKGFFAFLYIFSIFLPEDQVENVVNMSLPFLSNDLTAVPVLILLSRAQVKLDYSIIEIFFNSLDSPCSLFIVSALSNLLSFHTNPKTLDSSLIIQKVISLSHECTNDRLSNAIIKFTTFFADSLQHISHDFIHELILLFRSYSEDLESRQQASHFLSAVEEFMKNVPKELASELIVPLIGLIADLLNEGLCDYSEEFLSILKSTITCSSTCSEYHLTIPRLLLQILDSGDDAISEDVIDVLRAFLLIFPNQIILVFDAIQEIVFFLSSKNSMNSMTSLTTLAQLLFVKFKLPQFENLFVFYMGLEMNGDIASALICYDPLRALQSGHLFEKWIEHSRPAAFLSAYIVIVEKGISVQIQMSEVSQRIDELKKVKQIDGRKYHDRDYEKEDQCIFNIPAILSNPIIQRKLR